jgi:PPK2 family polyphosphate:nucleotide phosphotransferase
VDLPREVIRELMVVAGSPAGLRSRDTARTVNDWLAPTGHKSPKKAAESYLADFKVELQGAQEVLYAADSRALLLIFQALDAAGKDGTIKHVMSGVNPQGCSVTSFKRPSDEELGHDFLWRCAKALPERGRIGIFNRSYYEDVLVVRVHPELIQDERHSSRRKPNSQFWKRRFEDINAFERHLERSGTRVVKFFLHVSKEEQRRRFLDRLDDPAKRWKFSPADLAEREHFDEYQDVYEEALTATSTKHAPWYVIPADHKYAMRALVGGIVVHVIDELGLRMPEPDAEQLAHLEAARKSLSDESGHHRPKSRHNR